jgi:hypothetical protein
MIRRYRNNALFGPGPRRPLNRDDRARIRYLAGQHRLAGRLTASWWDVAEALLSFVGPDGRCDPSVASIGLRAGGLAASTVHLALTALERLGLLGRFPRLVRSGWRTEQTSSAYVLLPSGAPPGPSAPPPEQSSLKLPSSSSARIGAAAGSADREALENRDRQLRALGYGHLVGRPAGAGA